MPDYAEKALEAGWVQNGTKWTHKSHPGVTVRHPIDIWDKYLPENYKRPYSATPPERKPELVVDKYGFEPVEHLKQQETNSEVPEGPKRKPGRPPQGV